MRAASISTVLKAIQLPVDFAGGTLRLSVGRHTTADDVEAAVEIILKAVARQGVGKSSSDNYIDDTGGLFTEL